jgi:PAS domain S-box-containing protein
MTSSYQYTPYIWPMVTGAGLVAALGIYSWRHRSVPGATGLALITLCWVPKLLASALELTVRAFPTKVFWFQIEYSCLLPGLAAGLVFALEYAGLETWLNRRTFTLIAISILISAPLYFTNNLHHLVWTHLWTDGKIQYHSGVLNYVLGGYGVSLSVVTLSVFLGLFIQSPLHRWPVGLILLNMFVVRGLWFLDAAGLNPIKPLGLADVAANFSSVVYFLVLFRFRLFIVVPVARNSVIEQMHEGMLVLDAETRIMDLNRAAAELLGVAKAKVIGREITQVLGAYPDLLKRVLSPAAMEDEVWPGNGRCYRVHISPLANRRGFRLGKLILFYDISEEKRTQKQLQDHERKLASLGEREWLARELHDGVGQVLAAAHLQVKSASEFLARGQVIGAKTSLTQLAEVIREGKAHVGEYLFGVKSWSSNDQFFNGLRRYVTNYGPNAGVRTELVLPPEIERSSLGEAIETQLQRIIQEALTNIRKHASARSARVIFALEDGQVGITIEDDGQGFDPEELKDSEGFGLRSMRGRAEAVGACFEVKSSPGNGTQVIVQVPWRKGEA